MPDTCGVCAIIPWNQQQLHPCVLGMGILVSPREVLTCAHVASVGATARDQIRLCFPFPSTAEIITGRLDRTRLFPPNPDSGSPFDDVAVILLDRDAPVAVARLSPHQDGVRVKAYGFRRNELNSGDWVSHPTGEWAEGKIMGRQPRGRVQFDGLRGTGARIEPGFSGGGVYHPEHDAVVGMIVESDREPARKMAQFLDTGALLAALGWSAPPSRQLPGRDRELRYLQRLLSELEKKAPYSPLEGIAELAPSCAADPLLEPWAGDQNLALLHFEPRREERSKKEFTDALQAFREVHRAALLGTPGSGKSTTLRRLAADLARQSQDSETAPLPLLLSLGSWRDEAPLAQFIAAQAPEIGPSVDALDRAGRLALLLDGLNEMPTGLRAGKAQEILAWIERLHPDTQVVVSCRAGDYTGDLDLGLDRLTLQELRPERVREILHLWVAGKGGEHSQADSLFWQLAGDPALADVLQTWISAGSTEERFWSVNDLSEEPLAYQKTTYSQEYLWRRHVPNARSLLKLAANPFLLTMLFHVWRGRGELPRNRGDLFQRFVNVLLAREGLVESASAQTAPRVKLISGLTSLAWSMQWTRVQDGPAESGDFGVLTVAPRTQALESFEGDEELLKKALDATLLEGDEELRFRHQLLQEYFTALALRERIETVKASELWPPERWWQRSGWEEAAVLLVGFYPGDCSTVLHWVAEAQPEVAAQCAQESGAKAPDGVLQAWKDAWLPLLTDAVREQRPEARAALGRALGRLKLDERRGVGLTGGVPDIDWVKIPAGEFPYQDGERRKVATFHMARYPVTNTQYEAFLNSSDGYGNDRWWEGMTDPERTPAQPRWTEGNHPRETVSWHEAMAFCGWLSARLGYEVRLPAEWEWERAARGVEGREYPWGNGYQEGHANIVETYAQAGRHYLGRTSAVGMYPMGVSSEGVHDLAGNVWEWCVNEYEKAKRTQRGGAEPRVLRGGSWISGLGYARAVFRINLHPINRNNNFGFRVVCSSPIR